MNPLDYSLCQQTVTVYQKKGEAISRKIAENCYFSQNISTPTEPYGKSKEKKFLLIIPGDFDLQPGDRIYDGIGPEEVEWQMFVPAFTDDLYEVGRVKKQQWENEVTHVEGRDAL